MRFFWVVLLIVQCSGGLPIRAAMAADTTPWQCPAGVPAPAFGIEERHTMYAGATYDFGAGLEPYRDAGAGPYTHYVDNTSPGATDSGNPFGTKDRPRATFPSELPAGSVVEIHGGPYAFRNLLDKLALFGHGTAERPVFIRGASERECPLMGRDVLVLGSYMIAENLRFEMTRISIRPYVPGEIHHIALRKLVMHGDGKQGRSNSAIDIGMWNRRLPDTIHDVVVWQCRISGYGNWQPTAENDECGVAVSGYDVSNTWLLENHICHMGGDSIRVGNNAGWTPPYTSHHAFIAGNELHANGENAVDVKAMRDIVVSRNLMYGFRPSVSDPGAAVVVHYNPANVWLVANRIHDAVNALSCSGVEDLYVCANVMYDVDTAVRFWGDGEIHFVGNTMTRMNSGIVSVGGNEQPHPLVNNLLCELNDGHAGYLIDYPGTALAASSPMHHNLLNQSVGLIRIRWGGKVYNHPISMRLNARKGDDCIVADPCFVDAGHDDFRLSTAPGAASPAIDRAGVTGYGALFAERFGLSLGFDADGRPRPLDGDADGVLETDIGAYEALGPAATARPGGN